MAVVVKPAKTDSILNRQALAAGSDIVPFILDADGLLVSLYVRSVTGSVTVSVWTETRTGETVKVLEFAPQVAATADLLIERTDDALANCRVVATYTGACDFEVQVKGMSDAWSVGSPVPVVLDEPIAVTFAAVTVEVAAPTTPIIQTLAMPVAGTEYTYTLPAGTAKFTARGRVPGTLRVGVVPGFTTDYLTITAGTTWSEDALDLAAVSIYVISTVPANTLEILSWV